MIYIAILYLCPMAFAHCDSANYTDKWVFSRQYPDYQHCAAEAAQQLKTAPVIKGNATMQCERR